MPYTSEKIIIAGTKYDRRRKLSEEQKEYMRRLRKEEQLSYNQLAKLFSVSKRTAQFVCCPEKYEKAKAQFRARRKEGRYKVDNETWSALMDEHRKYKQQLYVEGKIK